MPGPLILRAVKGRRPVTLLSSSDLSHEESNEENHSPITDNVPPARTPPSRTPTLQDVTRPHKRRSLPETSSGESDKELEGGNGSSVRVTGKVNTLAVSRTINVSQATACGL